MNGFIVTIIVNGPSPYPQVIITAVFISIEKLRVFEITLISAIFV